MTERYTIRREAAGPAMPLGAAGAGLAGALLGAIIGLAIPTSLIETLSYQLYLDTIVAAAAPPLGRTAHIVAALAFALLLGAIGYGVARLMRVQSSGSLSDLLYRLRGHGADDEADAPVLRSADRHPDAPARRPFSATRDLPAAAEDYDDADDEGELLLDTAFLSDPEPATAEMAPPAPEPLAMTSGAHDDADHPEHDWAEWESIETVEVTARTPATPDPIEEDDAFYIAPPHLDDWEVAEPEPVVAAAVAPPSEPATASAPRPRPAPLDLSVARLDELIARLEQGLTRRSTMQASPNEGALAASEGEAPVLAGGGEPLVDDPAFPHDPALAAALATLRKMTRHAG